MCSQHVLEKQQFQVRPAAHAAPAHLPVHDRAAAVPAAVAVAAAAGVAAAFAAALRAAALPGLFFAGGDDAQVQQRHFPLPPVDGDHGQLPDGESGYLRRDHGGHGGQHQLLREGRRLDRRRVQDRVLRLHDALPQRDDLRLQVVRVPQLAEPVQPADDQRLWRRCQRVRDVAPV